MDRPLRVLVVDDSIVYRKLLSNIITALPNTELVGTAPNGKVALRKIETSKPELVTLDVEMPELDGMATLQEIRNRGLKVGVVMVSSYTTSSAKATIQALELGALDFIAKPQGGSTEESIDILKKDLEEKIKLFEVKRGAKGVAPPRHLAPYSDAIEYDCRKDPFLERKRSVVAIGVSTGGPRALAEVIPKLPETMGAPIVIVQHMPPLFTKQLAESLDNKSSLRVVEATDGEEMCAGTVYIAPGGKHMVLRRRGVQQTGGSVCTVITDDPPENNCKPAVDVLFRSVHSIYHGDCVGVMMTGMGHDGTKEFRVMQEKAAYLIVQNRPSCVIFGMPSVPVQEGIYDCVCPLKNIAEEIMKVAKMR